MTRKNLRFVIFLILLIGFFAGNLVYPAYFNKGVDFVNSKTSLNLPHFWEKPFKLGLDLQGGAHLVYRADLSEIEKGDEESSMRGLRDVIERRVNMFGVREPIVRTQQIGEEHRLIVELAGIKDVSKAIDEIGKTPYLEFKIQRSQEEAQKIKDVIEKVKNATSQEQIKNIENVELAQKDPNFKPTDLTGKYLKSSEVSFDQTTYQPRVLLHFNEEGKELFSELTGNHVDERIAIYIDGQLISAPTVNEKITQGTAQITGDFSIEEAKELARNLNAGALPVPIELISEQTVGPTLGEISLQKSLKAGMYGFLAILVFMIIFYKMLGVIAALALLIYVAIVLALFKLIPVTLTLAGIGGFILSIGMAVDANILIFSRMKEELQSKRTFGESVREGFSRAWPSIRDSNLTTLLVAIILFTFGTSFVKGFALTLSIGIVVSIFSAVFVTRSLVNICAGTFLEKIKGIWK